MAKPGPAIKSEINYRYLLQILRLPPESQITASDSSFMEFSLNKLLHDALITKGWNKLEGAGFSN
jgi:hypothetical protein